MKRYRRSHTRLCFFLPLCLTLSATSAAVLSSAVLAVHSEPTKSAKAGTPAPLKDPRPELTPVTLLGLVRSAKILEPDYPVHVTLQHGEATLATVRHPKATDQDCKIDAVLLAKAVMDAYPKEVSRVKYILGASNSDSMQEVTVTTGDVKAYATGTISKDDLLSSLELKKTDNATDKDSNMDIQTEGSSPVVPGVFRIQRQLLAGRIDKLKANGTGTKPYEEMLAKIESDVQKPPSEISSFDVRKELNELYTHLNDQEQAIKEAQHPYRGGPASSHPKSEIQQKIEDLKAQGQDVQGLFQALRHIQQLKQEGNDIQANQERKALMEKLGIDPSRGRRFKKQNGQ